MLMLTEETKVVCLRMGYGAKILNGRMEKSCFSINYRNGHSLSFRRNHSKLQNIFH
jgi:hypothetical protein